MEFLKRIMIREADGSNVGDKAFFVENLPENLIYTYEPKMVVDSFRPGQPLVVDFVEDEHGRRKATGAKERVLRPGIELSQTGDNSFVFFTNYNESRARLKDIDTYIAKSVPVMERVPARIPLSAQPGNTSAGVRPLSDLPSVVLPGPVSPPESTIDSVQAPAPARDISKPARRPMSDEHKAKIKASLVKARASRHVKPLKD